MGALAQRPCVGEFLMEGQGSLDAERCELRAYSQSEGDVHKQMVSLLVPGSSLPYAHCGNFSPGPGGWMVGSLD